jgi:hypothetical protein
MTRPIDLDERDDDTDFDTRAYRQKITGMVIPYIMTSNGKIIINN